MDIEQALISRVVHADEMGKAIDENLSARLFDGPSREVWEWCIEHYRTHGVSPGSDALSQAHPSYELMPTTETVSYYASQLRHKFAYNTALEHMREAGQILAENGDPMDAVEIMREAVQQVDDLGSATADVDWAYTVDERFQKYRDLADAKGIDGIESGFPTLDLSTQGFHPEELVFIVARQGVGKTWLEVVMAHHNWMTGHKPILFSKEMSSFQIARRLDSRNFKLPYQELRSGKLDFHTESRWKEEMDKIRGERPFYIIGEEGGGVSLVAAKIERYKPDIVYIDGMYLMEDDRRGDSSWQRITNVARDLKRLAKRAQIPIVVSMQFNRSASDSRGDASQIAYADVAKEADLILGMFQTEDQRLNRIMELRILKQREGERGTISLVWDMENMDFTEIGNQTSSLTEAEDEPVSF